MKRKHQLHLSQGCALPFIIPSVNDRFMRKRWISARERIQSSEKVIVLRWVENECILKSMEKVMLYHTKYPPNQYSL